uniref:Uncharacterized protein n=1 Tax=Hucho hucho TaxID=62062 RepID=A0A4W5M5D3_9TELE
KVKDAETKLRADLPLPKKLHIVALSTLGRLAHGGLKEIQIKSTMGAKSKVYKSKGWLLAWVRTCATCRSNGHCKLECVRSRFGGG